MITFKPNIMLITKANRKSKASFGYITDTYKGNKVVYITDQSVMPQVTVTNDIENVIADIATSEEIDPKDYLFLYKDGEGRWDAWDAEYNDFVILGERNSLDAIEVYLGKIQNDNERKQNDAYERSQA